MKHFLQIILDLGALVFGVINTMDYLFLKVKGYTLIFSALIEPAHLHYFFQELFFYAGGLLSLGWLSFRLLTQYQAYRKAKKEVED